jgi:hypothetical protein
MSAPLDDIASYSVFVLKTLEQASILTIDASASCRKPAAACGLQKYAL